ncbi:hypothetical protein ACU60T_25105 [Klebsiella aerogenes]
MYSDIVMKSDSMQGVAPVSRGIAPQQCRSDGVAPVSQISATPKKPSTAMLKLG